MTALALLLTLMAQDADMPALNGPVRPMIECSEHLNDDRALRNCMEDLLRDAECDRRASLLMIGDNAANVGIDCRVSLTRSRTRELIEQ
jgi:hypothetical protein